jgi:MGT family glycosyltransferase
LLPRLLQELAVDGVLFDHVLSAGGTAAERVGLPFVSVCTALPWLEDQHVPPPFTSWTYATDARTMRRYRLGYAAWRWYVRPMLDRINHERRRWNLPRFSHIDETLSPLAQISQLCADCDYPRRKLPDVFHYIGSLTASREMKVEVSFPWDRLDGRPLIFASLGTVHNNRNLRVFRKILNGCAGLDAQIVLVLGQTDAEEEEPLREQLGAIPDNAIVVDFAPQVPLLQKASLLITHAGVNTVMETANTGLPILALPRNYDQMGMAARIERIGVGRALSFARSTPEQIGQSVRQLLSDESFRRQSATLRKAIVAAGGVRRAADIAEEALLSRRPVRSNSHSHVAPKPHGWTVSARGGLVPR